MAFLELNGLTKEFGSFRAIDNVSLSIPEGAFVSFLGPSGCGKTTTLRCVAGLEEASSGSVSFRGRDVTRVPVESRNIGMVFQNYALFPHLTVAQNIGFGLKMRGAAPRAIASKVENILGLVQLSGYDERYPRELSGGQQQRVALARALVFDPDILLLDEPLANLDAKLRVEMRSFIRTIQQQVGITTIYVTHDQSEAMTMSDVVVVMFDGKVHQSAAPYAVYAQPHTEKVAGFIGAANIVTGKHVDGIVQTDFARLPVSGSGQGDREGRAVLRPEDIGLSMEKNGESFPVKIRSVEFLGSLAHYTVETASGVLLSVQGQGRQMFKPGEDVFASVTVPELWLLP